MVPASRSGRDMCYDELVFPLAVFASPWIRCCRCRHCGFYNTQDAMWHLNDMNRAIQLSLKRLRHVERFNLGLPLNAMLLGISNSGVHRSFISNRRTVSVPILVRSSMLKRYFMQGLQSC